LAPPEGHYVSQRIDAKGAKGAKGDMVEMVEMVEMVVELVGRQGKLRGTRTTGDETTAFGLAFYRPDYVLDLDAEGQADGTRSDFVRAPNGSLGWFRSHGRLSARQQ
jgi:hypothetical protein